MAIDQIVRGLSLRSIIVAAAALLLLTASASATVYNVSTAADLRTKLGIVDPGDQIVLANGTYTGNFTLSRSGTSSSIILVKPLNPGGATFTNGEFKLDSNYAQLERFTFNNSGVWITGNNNRVTRNTFINGTRTYLTEDAAVALSGTASFNRIDYNEITNWAAYGIRLTATATGMTGNRADHNHLHDSTTVSNAEAIQLGSGSGSFPHNLGTIVEYNLVSNIDVDEEREVISVKSSGNTIRYNTFSNPNQDNIVSQRGGDDNTYKNNTLKGYDFASYGEGHYIIGNRLQKNSSGQNGRLLIKAGKPSTHPQSIDLKVGGNLIEGAFVIGHQNTSSYTLAAIGTRHSLNTDLSGNAKSVTLALQSDTQAVSPYPSGWPAIGTPVEVTSSQVGPNAPPEEPPPGGTTLVGHWELDESSGTSASDSSGNGNNGTLQNGPVWTAGQIGNALSFDGVDDIVNCGSGTTLDNLPALTIAAWINATDMGEGGFGRIVSKAVGWELMTANTNQLTFSVDHATTDLKRRASQGSISTGEWRHVAVTWDGSATASNIHIYVDGEEVSYDLTTNASGARESDGSSNLYVGNDSAGTRTFKGKLDEVRVYNGVLSASEIQAIYEAGTNVPSAPTNLVATAVGSSAIDLSWSDVANETGYKIERKTGAGGTYAEIDTTGANVTSYNDTGLSASTEYYYKMRATNASGDSGYSNEVSATTQASGGPPYGSTISLYNIGRSKYVRADSAENYTLKADATAVSAATKFLVVDNGDGSFSLQHTANSKYAYPNATTFVLSATGTSIGIEDKYTWSSNGDGTISIQSVKFSPNYVFPRLTNGDRLEATGATIGAEDKYTWSLTP